MRYKTDFRQIGMMLLRSYDTLVINENLRMDNMYISKN